MQGRSQCNRIRVSVVRTALSERNSPTESGARNGSFGIADTTLDPARSDGGFLVARR